MIKREIIALSIYIFKESLKYLNPIFKSWKKIKPTEYRVKEIINSRSQLKEIIETKSCEKKIAKPLEKTTKKKREYKLPTSGIKEGSL